MRHHVRNIDQHYWHNTHLPQVEIRSTNNSTQEYKAHSHAAFSIGVIKSGQTRLSCNGQKLNLRAGDIVVLPPDLVHACNPISGEPRSYHMIYLDTEWALGSLSDNYGLHTHLITARLTVISDPCLTSTLLRSLTLPPTQKNTKVLVCILRQILSLTCLSDNQDRSETDIAKTAKQLLLKDTENPPTLKKVANIMGLTQETVIRHFRTAYGITPKAFVNNTRIENAKELLRNGTEIVQVALDVGYMDQSQFHHAFVRHTAATPRQYQHSKSIFNNTP